MPNTKTCLENRFGYLEIKKKQLLSEVATLLIYKVHRAEFIYRYTYIYIYE